MMNIKQSVAAVILGKRGTLYYVRGCPDCNSTLYINVKNKKKLPEGHFDNTACLKTDYTTTFIF